MNPFKASRIAVAASITLVLAGCASARPISAIDTSSIGYQDESITPHGLKSSGVAVLPVTSSTPGDASPAERAGTRVAMEIEGKQVCAIVLPPAEVKERLAQHGITGEVDRMMKELPERGLDRATLGAMAEATGCRYFLQAHYQSGSSYHLADVDGHPHGSRAVTARLNAQLWDAASGEVVWEGIGGGAALTNPPHGGTAGQVESIAISGLANVVGKHPSVIPEPRDVGELHHREHMEIASVNGENAARADAAITGLELFAAVLQVAAAVAD